MYVLTGSDEGCCNVYKVGGAAWMSLKGVLCVDFLVCTPVMCHLYACACWFKREHDIFHGVSN